MLKRKEPSEKGAGTVRERGGKWERELGMKGVETGRGGGVHCGRKV